MRQCTHFEYVEVMVCNTFAVDSHSCVSLQWSLLLGLPVVYLHLLIRIPVALDEIIQLIFGANLEFSTETHFVGAKRIILITVKRT